MSKANLYKDRIKAFWHFVDKRKTSECWDWQGSLNAHGYGRIKFKGRHHSAHRLSFEINVGPIPVGLFVCHRCDNRRCVNPKHLYLGTAQDNMNDAAARGRVYSGADHWSHHKPERVLRGERHGRAKLSTVIVSAIRQEYANGGNRSKLAAKYHVNWSTINRIVKGEIWK